MTDHVEETTPKAARDVSALLKCSLCDEKFSVFRIKRTCKVCFRRVCANCSSKTPFGEENEPRRVCKICSLELKGTLHRSDTMDERMRNSSPIFRHDDAPSLSYSNLDNVAEPVEVPLFESGVSQIFQEPNNEPGDSQVSPLKHSGVLHIHVIEGRGLLAMDTNLLGQKTKSDPYCAIHVDSENYTARTRVLAETLAPVWNEQFKVHLKFPPSTVKLAIWDKDIASKDDPMGSVIVDLSRMEINKKFSGWFPVVHPSKGRKSIRPGTPNSPNSERNSLVALPPASQEQAGRTSSVASPRSSAVKSDESQKPAGMIHLSIQFSSNPKSLFLAYVRHRIAILFTPPPAPPAFNLNELYSPLMLLIDVVYTRLIGPVIDLIMTVTFWQNWRLSTAVLVALWPATFCIAYWPSFCFFGLAIQMRIFKQRFRGSPSIRSISKLPEVSAAGSKDSDDVPLNNLTLGGFVVRITRLAPSWLTEMLAGLQEPTKIAAETVLICYDLLHWRHPESEHLFYALIALGVVFVFAPFSWMMWIILSGAILAFSPPLAFVQGGVDYLMRPMMDRTPEGMVEHFDVQYLSDDAKRFVSSKKSWSKK